MTSVPITLPDLVNALIERDRFGATLVTLATITPADARKWDGGPLFKLSIVNCLANFSYARAVDRVLARTWTEDQWREAFVAKQRSWGTRVSGSIIEWKGRYYLNAMLRRSSAPVYLTPHGETWDPVPLEAIAHLLRPAEVRAVQVRDFGLHHIRSLRFGGQRYHVIR